MSRIKRVAQRLGLLVFLIATSSLAFADWEPGPSEVVVVRDVMVPMRDGVELATDLYLPAKNGRPVSEKLPAVLMRTPYNKERWGPHINRYFASHGYLSVVQDCRGRYKSGGEFFPFRDEPLDGYDTIEWLARHPSCNGKVGMHGVSYMAWVQYHASTQRPPHLVTIIPHCGPINAYKYNAHIGGACLLAAIQWNIDMAATSKEAQRDPTITKALEPMRHGEAFMRWAARMPWQRGKTPLSAAPRYEDIVFQLFFDNSDYNRFWRRPGFAMDDYLDQFPEMPMLSIVGWYEIYPRSVIETHQAMVSKGRQNQFLLVGPWTHANTRASCGDANFGEQASVIPGIGSFEAYELAWFNRWLRGDRATQLGKPIKIFVMGGGDGRRGNAGRLNHGGAWHTDNSWPPEGSAMTHFYLQPGKGLSREKPTTADSATSYDYDPRNTVSSDGRCEVDYGPASTTGFTGMGPRDQIQQFTLPGHGQPGKPTAERKDVLVFQTDTLKHDVKMAGNIRAHLRVSSDAPDTDFYVKLIDVYPPSKDYPSGYAFPITDGVLRARYRESFEKPRLMKAGKVYEVTVAIQPAANLFKAGHRIRIDISSSSFPNFDINRNTGDPRDPSWRIAHNIVHHDAKYLSSIELPILHNGPRKQVNRLIQH